MWLETDLPPGQFIAHPVRRPHLSEAIVREAVHYLYGFGDGEDQLAAPFEVASRPQGRVAQGQWSRRSPSQPGWEECIRLLLYFGWLSYGPDGKRALENAAGTVQ